MAEDSGSSSVGMPSLNEGATPPSMRRCVSEQKGNTRRETGFDFENRDDGISSNNKKVRVLGNYELGQVLGRGKFSKVAEGIHRGTRQKFALKIMRQDEFNLQGSKKLMATELQALTRIKHANVIRLFGVDWDADYPHRNGSKTKVMVIALELAPNGGLLYHIQTKAVFSEDISRTYFRQLISAVCALHENGITHRDIKPENLLLDKNFNLKVADFGLSKIFPAGNYRSCQNGLMHTPTGTKAYMAPELFQSNTRRPYTSACDIWSCGVVLFVMRLGQPPIQESSRRDPLFNCLYHGRYSTFWRFHLRERKGVNQNTESVSPAFRALIESLLSVSSRERLTLNEIKHDRWCEGSVLSTQELLAVFTNEHPVLETTDAAPNCQGEREKKEDSEKGTKDTDPELFSPKNEVGCMVILSCLSPDTVARRIGDQLRHMRSLGVAFEQPSPFIFNVKIRKDVPSFITSSHHAFPDLKTSTSSFATARCSIEISSESKFEDFLNYGNSFSNAADASPASALKSPTKITLSRVEFQHVDRSFVNAFKDALLAYEI